MERAHLPLALLTITFPWVCVKCFALRPPDFYFAACFDSQFHSVSVDAGNSHSHFLFTPANHDFLALPACQNEHITCPFYLVSFP